MKKVVIYPGRFQPMLSHHVKVYRSIQEQFPGADVYIGTSDKVDGEKSPFNFQEKRLIAKAHGIDPSKFLLAPRPYHNMDYEANFKEMSDQFDPEKVQIFFAVGEKDVLQRFPMSNLHPETGLDMKIKPNKDTGKVDPKYYQMINTYKQDPQPMSVRGYIAPIDNVIDDMEEVESASAFRKALKDAPDIESAKRIFTNQFGEMNNQVFDLVYNKIAGNKMNENLNILRKLAGMEEAAPVEFETELNPGKVKFMEPNKSSAKMSIANRFPEKKDPNNIDDKKDVFIQALLKSPANLLSEINERIDPKDENSLMVSDKLSKIIDKLTDRYNEPSIMGLEDDDKKFVLKLVNSAIQEMDLVAGDDSEPEYQPDPEEKDELDSITNPLDKKESLDLSDIRSEYKVEEDVYANYITYIGPNGEKLGTEDYDGELEPDMMAQMASDEECKMLCDKHNIDHDDIVGCLKFDDGEATMQDGEELPDGTIAFYGGKEGSVEEGKVKDMAMDQAEEFYDKVSQYVDDLNDVEEAILRAWDDDDDNPPGWALDDETRAILQDAGKMEPEQEEPEMEESAPEGEPSQEDEMYNKLITAYENSEEDLAEVMGLSMKELDQEMTEYAMDHNLHMDDDRDEVVHGYIEDVVHNADYKDHGEMDVDPADMEMEEALNRMRHLAGMEEASSDTDLMLKDFNAYGKNTAMLQKEFAGELPKDTIATICQNVFDEHKKKGQNIDMRQVYNDCRDKLKSVMPA